MTGRELVERAIKFQHVDRVPAAVLDGYAWIAKHSGMSFDDMFNMEPERAADFIAEKYEQFGSDMIYANAQASGAVREVMGGKMDFSVKGANPVVKKSSLGEIGDIKNFTVREVYEKAINHRLFKSLAGQLEALNKKCGGEKLILAFGTGPLTTAAGMVGMEKLMMGLYEDPQGIRRLADFSVELTKMLFDYQIAHGATAVSIADPVSSVNLISQEFFEQYTMPGLREICAEERRHGAPIMLHICGDATTRLEPLKSIDIDMFSVDRVDMAQALETARGHYAVFGNLDTVEYMLSGSQEMVMERSKELCKLAGHEGGFILAPGCDLPPDTPLENIRAMTLSSANT